MFVCSHCGEKTRVTNLCLLKIACNNVNTDGRKCLFLLLETKIYSWSAIAKFSPLFYESKKLFLVYENALLITTLVFL